MGNVSDGGDRARADAIKDTVEGFVGGPVRGADVEYNRHGYSLQLKPVEPGDASPELVWRAIDGVRLCELHDDKPDGAGKVFACVSFDMRGLSVEEKREVLSQFILHARQPQEHLPPAKIMKMEEGLVEGVRQFGLAYIILDGSLEGTDHPFVIYVAGAAEAGK